MNLNDLAREVTLSEGGKVSVSIAQVKEIMKLLLIKLANEPEDEVNRVIKRYKNR